MFWHHSVNPMRVLFWLLGLTVVTVGGLAAIAAPLQTGRYTAAPPLPNAAQREPLNEITVITFPATVITVGEAVRRSLQGTGYRLMDRRHWAPVFVARAAQPLAEVHRVLGPMRRFRMLRTLVGPAFALSVDPVHRLVAVELAPEAAVLGFGATANPPQDD